MPELRLFVATSLRGPGPLSLPPEAARHVQVRRLQPGDALTLFDGCGGEWHARVAAMTRGGVDVEVMSHQDPGRELPLEVTLAVGMPANERMDWLVEKAVELGAVALQPLLCDRGVLRLSGDRAERRRLHWQAQAVAATEQCGRTQVMAVRAVRPLADWWHDAPSLPPLRLLLSPRATRPPMRPAAGTGGVLLSGPEGGFTDAEEGRARQAGFVPVNLGPRVLRAETAPLALLAWLGMP